MKARYFARIIDRAMHDLPHCVYELHRERHREALRKGGVERCLADERETHRAVDLSIQAWVETGKWPIDVSAKAADFIVRRLVQAEQLLYEMKPLEVTFHAPKKQVLLWLLRDSWWHLGRAKYFELSTMEAAQGSAQAPD